MNREINQLIQFGLKNQMIQEEDKYYAVNLLLDLLHLDSFEDIDVEEASLYDILDNMLAYAVEHELVDDDTTSKDLFDTRIMNCIMPRPSEVVKTFKELYKEDPVKATDYYYNLSINSNYIRKSRTDKNILFNHYHKYGEIQISINLSKPEKDPKEIAKAKLVKSSGYPKCLLCKENVGFAGHQNHAARQTHRIIPLVLNNTAYNLQYSPYVYYNEHCIIFNDGHVPMQVDKNTFKNLFGFIKQFPHYMLGSNADLPIVGGSILTHDHYQGGKHHFPIEDAKVIKEMEIKGYNVKAELLNWPLTTLRLTGEDENEMIELCDHVLQKWIHYSDESLDIIAFTNDERHNTITPISRMKDGKYQIDLVLRNNRTNEQYPDGIFHPHQEHHHIKKENIGLIEVMGLAILPARLKDEMNDLKACLLGKANIDEVETLAKHKAWFEELKQLEITEENVQEVVEKEITKKFVAVLENAGVYKMDEAGIAGFTKFVESLSE